MTRFLSGRNQCKAVKGFTLIEILVVLLIISIITSVALLNVSQNENRQMKNFAKNLYEQILLAQEQAMLQPAILGLAIEDRRISFMRYQTSAVDRNNHWEIIEDRTLAAQQIPDNTELRINLTAAHDEDSQPKAEEKDEEENTTGSLKPQIIFSPNGEVNQFVLSISKVAKSARYKILGAESGEIIFQTMD